MFLHGPLLRTGSQLDAVRMQGGKFLDHRRSAVRGAVVTHNQPPADVLLAGNAVQLVA